MDNQQSNNKVINIVSNLAIIVCWLLEFAVFMGGFLALMTLFDSEGMGGLTIQSFGIEVSETDLTTGSQWILACLIALQVGFYLFGLAMTKKLFRAYRRGQIFTAHTVACYRKLRQLLVVYLVVNLLVFVYFNVLSTGDWNSIQFNFGTSSPLLFIVFLGFIAVSFVMEEAYKLKQNDDLVI